MGNQKKEPTNKNQKQPANKNQSPRPHTEVGQKGQDTGMGNRQNPRAGYGGPTPGGMPNQPIPGAVGKKRPAQGPANRGSDAWIQKHPNGPIAQRTTRPGGMPGGPPRPGPGGHNQDGIPSWQQRGFDSKEAAQSVQRQYGLVQGPGGEGSGDWVKPDYDFLVRQMEAEGWGPEFQASSMNEQGTPISIGGARWYSGKNGVTYSGEASDVPFRNQPVGGDYMNPTPYVNPNQRAGSRRPRTY
jgi:hypothetical protein